MISKFLKRAEKGESLWLPDICRAFELSEKGRRLIIRLIGLDGELTDYPFSVPAFEGEAEKDFVLRCLSARIYNILSLKSGREICIFYDEKDAGLRGLLSELPGIFMLESSGRRGLGKVINIADRMGKMLGGGGFSLSLEDIAAYSPAAPGEDVPAGNPCPSLQARAERAENKNCCGVDVGGSDIKLALSEGKRLVLIKEFDWNPSEYQSAGEIISPIIWLIRLGRAYLAAELTGAEPGLMEKLRRAADEKRDIRLIAELTAEAEAHLGRKADVLDAVGISYPDIVINDVIAGGETPKTAGIRASAGQGYEEEFKKFAGLKAEALKLCRPGGSCHICNDGSMAAFSAALETALSGDSGSVKRGVFANALGTDLGAGWLKSSGEIPAIPLEMYDMLLDMGNFPAARLSPEDLRSSRNENSCLPGLRRYTGQAAAYRLAYIMDKSMLEGFTEERDGILKIKARPEDMRKPCLDKLMYLASVGNEAAEKIFTEIGRSLAHVTQETELILNTGTDSRFLFGRFIKSGACFELISRGFSEILPDIRLLAADTALACSPLMKELAAGFPERLAQFAQAVGAIYYAL